MTKTGYLTRIALAALAITGGCIVGIILDHYAALPPVDGGEREPEREVDAPQLVRPDQHRTIRFPADDQFAVAS
jgi:hypothetical protein